MSKLNVTDEQLENALANNFINNWEYNFLKDLRGASSPSPKQIKRFNIIMEAVEGNVEEKTIEKNKKQDEASGLTVIPSDSPLADPFINGGYTDAKVHGKWFRKCECCGEIKSKEECYDSSWRKNHKRARGGQVVYSRRCQECEDTVGIKWGSN